jgi:hypothetical protein
MEESTKPGFKSLNLSSASMEHLAATRRWASFLAFLGFIVIGLMTIGAVGAMTFITQGRYSGGTAFQAVPLLVITVIYFFPVYFLWQFSRYSKQAIADADESSLELAFKYLRRHYSFMGFMLIVILVYYLIIAALFLTQHYPH